MDLGRARQVIHRPRRHSKESEGLASLWLSPLSDVNYVSSHVLSQSSVPAWMFRFIIDVDSYPGGKSQQGPG